MHLNNRADELRFLLRDRDTKFTRAGPADRHGCPQDLAVERVRQPGVRPDTVGFHDHVPICLGGVDRLRIDQRLHPRQRKWLTTGEQI